MLFVKHDTAARFDFHYVQYWADGVSVVNWSRKWTQDENLQSRTRRLSGNSIIPIWNCSDNIQF